MLLHTLSKLLLVLIPAEANLGVSRLRPDARYAQQPDKPVTFTFAPTAEHDRGVSMQKFRVQVWPSDNSNWVIDSGIISSSQPTVSLPLSAGHHHWAVQWWSDANETSPQVFSEVVVALGDDAWTDVPWLGGADVNEFYADLNALAAPKARVEVLVAALGFGYVTVNGQDVSPDLLSPSGWTNTEKRVLFRTYDISSLLNSSQGARLFVGLGCGYRCDPQNRFPRYLDAANQAAQKSYDSVPKVFRLQVRVDGNRVFDTGRAGWQQRQGPVVSDSVYGGETYSPHAASPWSAAKALPKGAGPHGAMVAASFPGVQVNRIDAPVSITNPEAGVFVVDFGSNVAGVCQISVPSVHAATVSLKHGELLQHAHLPDVKNPDPKRVYFGNLRSAEANDTLVLQDEGVEKWFPRFTYHGFRYVEVYGYPGTLTASSIQRLAISTAVETKTHGNFSDEVLQQIHLGSKGSQRSNLMQVPTDCPQRDERLGWMGDSSLSAASMLNHFHVETMAAAFVDSMTDEMGSDGSLTDVVPNQRYGGRPADLSWNAAFLSNLWSLWKAGHINSAKMHWPSVKTNVGFLEAVVTTAGGISKVPEKYGDWCPPPTVEGHGQGAKPSKGFAAAFSLVNSLQQAADLGQAIGGDAAVDAKAYAALAAKLRADFHVAYFNNSTNSYDNGGMTTYVLPLALGATPPAVRGKVFGNLLKYIKDHSNTWWGGIINNRFLFEVLHDNGAADVAIAMLKRKEYPSYGYMYFNEFEPARECMWELPDAPFEGTGMNSRNHHMFSSVGKYLMDHIGGLQMTSETELMAVAGRFEGHANVTIESARGIAAFAWSQGEHSEVKVSVPVGMVAHVHIPIRTNGVALIGAGPLSSFSSEQALPRGVLGVHRARDGGQDFHRIVVQSGYYELTTNFADALVI